MVGEKIAILVFQMTEIAHTRHREEQEFHAVFQGFQDKF